MLGKRATKKRRKLAKKDKKRTMGIRERTQLIKIDNKKYILYNVYTKYTQEEKHIMSIVKARKVGNSITITLPEELGVNIGEEFTLERGRNNVIMLVPKMTNPFDGISDLRMDDDFESMALLDHE